MLEINADEIAAQSVTSGKIGQLSPPENRRFSCLVQWLLRRCRLKAPYDNNKYYASEILEMLLQMSEAVRTAVGELGGIDVLLQVSAFD
jgi:hypothetical protein